MKEKEFKESEEEFEIVLDNYDEEQDETRKNEEVVEKLERDELGEETEEEFEIAEATEEELEGINFDDFSLVDAGKGRRVVPVLETTSNADAGLEDVVNVPTATSERTDETQGVREGEVYPTSQYGAKYNDYDTPYETVDSTRIEGERENLGIRRENMFSGRDEFGRNIQISRHEQVESFADRQSAWQQLPQQAGEVEKYEPLKEKSDIKVEESRPFAEKRKRF